MDLSGRVPEDSAVQSELVRCRILGNRQRGLVGGGSFANWYGKISVLEQPAWLVWYTLATFQLE